MTGSAQRGGAPLGFLTELPPIEAGAVLYLRLWCEGRSEQRQIQEDLSTALGSSGGSKAYKSFETLCDLCLRHSRRPLLRHSVHCKCFGGDESCFAHLIGAAAEGEREDALMIAMAFIRPDFAPMVSNLAEEVGTALKRMAAKAQRLVSGEAPGRTLH